MNIENKEKLSVWLGKNKSRINPAIFSNEKSNYEFYKIIGNLINSFRIIKKDDYNDDGFIKDLTEILVDSKIDNPECYSNLSELRTFLYRYRDLEMPPGSEEYTQSELDELVNQIQSDLYYYLKEEYKRVNKMGNSYLRLRRNNRSYGGVADIWYVKRIEEIIKAVSDFDTTVKSYNSSDQNQIKTYIKFGQFLKARYTRKKHYSELEGLSMFPDSYGVKYETEYFGFWPGKMIDHIRNVCKYLFGLLKTIDYLVSNNILGKNLKMPYEDWYCELKDEDKILKDIKFVPDEDNR